MGSRGTITLSIQPASGGLFPRHTLHHAPLQSGAVGLHLSLCSRVYVARANSKAPLSFPVETRAPRHGERSGNGRCFLRRPTPLILILLHIVGQIGGKCAWRPLGYRATRPPLLVLFILIFRERVANYDIDSLYKYFRTFPAKKHGRKEGSMARPPVESPYEAFVHLPNEDISAKIRWNERWPNIFRSDDFLQKVWSSVVKLRGGYRVSVFHAQNYSVYR